jgi:hypothetical protein
MFFTIKNKPYLSDKQLKTDTLLNAYFLIENYSLHASELLLDNYIKQQYDTTLKDMCINLLLSLTFHRDDRGNLVLLFKDPKHDRVAQLITYGNGVIPGSRILQIALNSKGDA